jgi:antitoxin (DNA-binding transcriptional repressor) of toxin-antitoxin stability system
MRTTDVADLHDNLRTYIHDVQNGDEIFITDAGQKVAKLIPVKTPNGEKPFDFDAFDNLPLPKCTGSVVEILLEDRQDIS